MSSMAGVSHAGLINHPISGHAVLPTQPDALMVFGFFSAVTVIVFYVHRNQSPVMLLALAVCLVASAVYGFLEGSWPLGLLEIMFAGSSLRQWSGRRRKSNPPTSRPITRDLYECESRISRMFGPR